MALRVMVPAVWNVTVRVSNTFVGVGKPSSMLWAGRNAS
jgi:hypothetical protein